MGYFKTTLKVAGGLTLAYLALKTRDWFKEHKHVREGYHELERVSDEILYIETYYLGSSEEVILSLVQQKLGKIDLLERKYDLDPNITEPYRQKLAGIALYARTFRKKEED